MAEQLPKSACRDEFTVVLLELDGNPGGTFKLKQNLQRLEPQALREHICKHAALPKSWNRTHLLESDLALSIGNAAISDEMSLHQNGQCCVPDGCDPLILSARVCSGVTDGTVITVTVLDTAPGRWLQMEQQAKQAKQQAEQFYKLGCTFGVHVGAADRQHYTRQRCCINLGFVGGGSVGGQQYSKQQCFIKAVEIDDQHAKAWRNLGYVGGGSVGGQQYTKKQCYVRALEVDDQFVGAWNNLGVVGGGSVGGQQYTKQQCYIRALEVDDQHTNAWQNLGVVGGGNVSGQQYTQQQCYIRAVENDDEYRNA